MAVDYKQRLQNLRNRRLGLDSRSLALDSVVALRESLSFGEPLYKSEAYEQRGKNDPVKYALGIMQEVDPEYTRISIEEGERVRKQLNSGLSTLDVPVTFDYQGSVPLNVHIQGVSDIDLLVLHDGFVTLDWSGPQAKSYIMLGNSALSDMLTLRSNCEEILDNKFPAANVDKNGAKSIAISGGSLRRKVDVVPSHWHDTADYQRSKEKHDREIKILDKTIPDTLANRPFMHMKRIEEKDSATNGCAKKVIRLLKSLRKDSDKDIKLTSYDIASLVWHFDSQRINLPHYLELTLIAITQVRLWIYLTNRSYTESLDVPDKSRKIIDSSEKFESLALLSKEVDQLAYDVARVLNPFGIQTNDDVIRSLNEARIH
ncbi:hypothetical protein ACWJKU_19880 (plasmid) [Methylocaldum sp. MU1018]|jgi:hypothetical protein